MDARIQELFEPVRQQYFVRPMVEQDIPFFMRDEGAGAARVVILAAMHPQSRGHVWKEVLLFHELRVCHIYGLYGHAHQVHRVLEYTTDCRWTLKEMQPDMSMRQSPWARWARHAAGQPHNRFSTHGEQVAVSRVFVQNICDTAVCM